MFILLVEAQKVCINPRQTKKGQTQNVTAHVHGTKVNHRTPPTFLLFYLDFFFFPGLETQSPWNIYLGSLNCWAVCLVWLASEMFLEGPFREDFFSEEGILEEVSRGYKWVVENSTACARKKSTGGNFPCAQAFKILLLVRSDMERYFHNVH